MTKLTAPQIAEYYGMEPLTGEGGYRLQTYVSDEILPEEVIPGRIGDRALCSAILFLMTEKAFSRMHRLPTDEIFHFYLGDKVELLIVYPDGDSKVVTFGNDILNGEVVQFTVPRNTWFGLRVIPGGEWSLVGTSMAPGFNDVDFEGGDYDEINKLLKNPEHKELLEILSGPANFELE